MSNQFGTFISEKRKKKNLTIRYLAQILNISASYLCDLEQGRKLPPQDDKTNLYDDLVIVLNLDDEEIQQMRVAVDNDLAEKSRTSPDMVNYISKNEEARIAFRQIKELEPTDNELKEVIEMLRNKMSQNRPIYRDDTIDSIAENFLSKNYPVFLGEPKPVNVEHIIENEGYLLQGISFADRGILGAAIFRDTYIDTLDSEGTGGIVRNFIKGGSILFDELEADKSESRYKTTLAHELGHMILHQTYYTNSNVEIKCRKDVIGNYNYKELITRNDWEEHQANWFASCILIPKSMLIKTIYNLAFNCEIPIPSKFKYLAKDEKYKIINIISEKFDVSKEMAKIRFEKIFLR